MSAILRPGSETQELGRPGMVFAFLKRHISEATVEEISRMTLTTDGRSAVFDVPTDKVKACHTIRY